MPNSNPATQADTPAAATAAPANRALSILSDSKKVEAIKEAMESREVFPTLADALEKLGKAASQTENFYGLPIAVKGTVFDSEGNPTEEIDESLYDGSMAALAYVGARVNKGDSKGTGIKGIVVFPVPTVESFLAEGDNGQAWIRKVVEKEVGLVAFRTYRDAGTLLEFQNGVKASPGTVAEYVAEYQRSGGGVDTKTFDALWNGLRLSLKNDMPALAKLLPGKAEVAKSMRSASYAAANHPQLEAAGVFAKLANILIQAAASNKDSKTGEAKPLDASAIQGWLDGRDELELATPKAEEKDFSILGSLNWGGEEGEGEGSEA